ncbi:hypothetical protein PAXINDRAFT_79821 [Paxillus involutus ATCC 200175]|uniref:Unplaced genomic scaffold PAXINscaffold_23, whole genome shotgun sequence n=1 Tax=Paxillus involutus ATCC 200175 TaxID=664439 RepID=A0A0C9SX08_PAXIN|nr:hypothetical protein PAXINDRAFT_79821 [Paxillus involutus ATCC 200175]
MAVKGGQSTNQTARSRKQQMKDLDVGIDFLINADNRSGLMCRRRVFDVCFDNAAAALQDWRESKTTLVYGWASLNDHGPSLIMPNSTLDRIIDCAHHRKIQTHQDLKRETGWTDSDQFGNEVIALIQRHATPRPSLFASTPLRPSTMTTLSATNLPPSPTKRRNRCGACGQEGHNSKRNCSLQAIRY